MKTMITETFKLALLLLIGSAVGLFMNPMIMEIIL